MALVGLVQINNSFANACYLPYTAGLLQAYFQHHSNRAREFSFLTPIYRRILVDDALKHLDGADIIALSVASWNFKLSLEIARRHKELYPDALVVLGGPHIPGNAERLLKIYPWVDIVCHGEGELTFQKILEAWPERSWDEINSVSYLQNGRFVSRSEEIRISELDSIPSAYLSGVFEPLLQENHGHEWLALLETNRGCPFSCSYCDWGSATRSKLLCFGMDRLRQEITWFAEHEIEFIFCCDSNFGIFPRDMDIVAAVAQAKQAFGYPKAFSVQNTKSSDRSYEIQKALSAAGLNKGVNLAMQSMHPGTLELIGRRNIPAEVFQDLQQRYTKDGIETFTDIILGLPGETYSSFTQGIDKIISSGQHNRIQFINLSILPNAPMADSAYRAKHGLESVESMIINIHGARPDDGGDIIETQDLVITSATMPAASWRETRVFSWMTSLLYFDKLLQIPIMLLHASTGLKYVHLIEAFMSMPQGEYPLLDELADFFMEEAALIQQGGSEFYYSQDWLGIYWPHDEYAYIRLSTEGRLEAFYEQAKRRLEKVLHDQGQAVPPWLEDAVNLNMILLKQPFHTEDLLFRMDYDLPRACYEVRRTGRGQVAKQPVEYRIDRTTEQWSTWEDWAREVVWYANKRGAYLYPYAKADNPA